MDSILKEYGAIRLEEANALEARKVAILSEIPELAEIEENISSLTVNHTIARIKGLCDSKEKFEVDFNALVSKKKELLKSKGYSPDDLEIKYTCNKCKDTGYEGPRMCSCFKDKITKALYTHSDFDELLKKENFMTFNTDYYSAEIQKGDDNSPLVYANKARTKAMDFVRSFNSSTSNLFITGNTGTGKTFLTNCIVKELYGTGVFVLYLTAIKFFDLLSAATFGKGTETDYLTSHINNCDLLIIDDLGTEISNTFTSSALFDCLDTRIKSKKHTIISTNLSLEDISARYTERISSRIIENYTLIKLSGDDIRIKKNLGGLKCYVKKLR